MMIDTIRALEKLDYARYEVLIIDNNTKDDAVWQPVEAYVASDEWRDKAGGYAIQETADRFVTALEEGGFDNVVGLPVALALALLEEVRSAPRALG